jgi:hypothetical protein
MHDDDVLSGAERRLRDVLRSRDERVNMVIGRALAGPRRPRRVGVRLLAAVTLAVIVLGALVVWRASAPRPPTLTILGSGSVIVVMSEDGRRWILNQQTEPAAHGQYVIAVPQ